MKRLLRVFAVMVCAGWAAGCGDGAAENTPKMPTDEEKARMMEQMKKGMPPMQPKAEQGSPGGAKEDGAEDKGKDEPGESSSKDEGDGARKADE